MATLIDNLGYNTYILKTIRSITECEKIIVYNKNSFIGDQNYSRLNLYNLTDIFFDVLYNRNTGNYDSRCCMMTRELVDRSEATEVPFKYTCNNPNTPGGFNIIIYVTKDNTPAGYTEFLNIQGKISEVIWIYLKFNVELYNIDLKLSNSLYKQKDSLPKNFIGSSLGQFSKSCDVKDKISKAPRDSWYTNHLTSFLNPRNKSSIALGDRTLLWNGIFSKIGFLKDSNVFAGEEYTNYQIGYYGLDIVLYSWTYLNDEVGLYYRITSLITQEDYRYTHQVGDTIIDVVSGYKNGMTLLYCAGKYLVFEISHITYTEVVLFDTASEKWVETKESRVIVDPFDSKMEIREFPKIQSPKTAVELLPGLSNVYLNISNFIERNGVLEVFRKYGDWFFIKEGNFCIATCMSYSVYMTMEEYRNCIILNDNTLLLKTNDDYYTIYCGNRQKEYWTENARSIKDGVSMITIPLGSGYVEICENGDPEIYRLSEVSIVTKDDLLYNTILDSFRHQSLYAPYKVPSRIIGAFGGVVFYINQNNNLNYI